MESEVEIKPRKHRRGVREIAEELETTERRAYYLLENNHVPGAYKEGAIWCLSIPRYRRAVHGEAE